MGRVPIFVLGWQDMPELTFGEERIFFREGDQPSQGKTPIFIHGAGGSSYPWTHLIGSPSPGYRCIAIDLPGHGQSGGNGRDSVKDYVDVLREFLKALNPGPYVLIGHSMGGAIVQLYALDRPEGLKGIVLVGTGARLRVAPLVFDSLEGDFTSAIELSTGWAFSEKTSPAVVQPYIQETLKGSPKVMINDFRACDAFNIMDRVQEISLPTLIICGAEDKLTPTKYSQYLHDKIPGSTLEIIPDAGHMVMLEKPKEFNHAFQQFINSVVPWG